MDLVSITTIVTPILDRYGVKRAAVFGSTARGEAGANSDIDLMIESAEPLGLFKLAELNYVLEDALKRKVDLVKNTALKPSLKENILRDAVYVYG